MREAHLGWAKERALVYADAGDAATALASIASDLNKHPETVGHSGVQLMAQLIMSGHLRTPEEIRKYIEGFN